MSGSTVFAELTLPVESVSVGRARRAVRQALTEVGATALVDSAQLAVSELVTNAVVHAGTEVQLRITAQRTAVHVEIEDWSHHLPIRRTWADTSGTGRGLVIVDEHVDRWSAVRTEDGKVVWFEIGEPTTDATGVPEPDPVPATPPAPRPAPASDSDTVEVTLRHVPLLMHWAWQEHASTLLREYLLYALERDEGALDEHAAASAALSVLDEQLPKPELPTEAGALMASSVEPGVSADEVVLSVPTASVRHFAVLDDLLARAVEAARDGLLLAPPTQPEIVEMREWLCGEVARQAAQGDPTAWVARTDVRVPLDTDSRRARIHDVLSESDEPFIGTDDASVVVAVSASLVQFLGYRDESDLLGRRILVVVPPRFRQAHVAGTTLHATNGRDVLLNQWLTVPVVRADGSEVPVELRVETRRLDDDVSVIVARFRLPGS